MNAENRKKFSFTVSTADLIDLLDFNNQVAAFLLETFIGRNFLDYFHVPSLSELKDYELFVKKGSFEWDEERVEKEIECIELLREWNIILAKEYKDEIKAAQKSPDLSYLN